MKPIDVGEFFSRRVITSELGSSLNNNDTIDESVVPQGEIEASVFAEVVQEADRIVGEVSEEVEDTDVPENKNK